jgi:hypothetical protein
MPGAAEGQYYHNIARESCCVLCQVQLATVMQTHLHEREMEGRRSQTTCSSNCDPKKLYLSQCMLAYHLVGFPLLFPYQYKIFSIVYMYAIFLLKFEISVTSWIFPNEQPLSAKTTRF